MHEPMDKACQLFTMQGSWTLSLTISSYFCQVYLRLMGSLHCWALKIIRLLGILTFLSCGIPPSIQKLWYIITVLCNWKLSLLWHRWNTRQNGQCLLKTCLPIFNITIITTSWSNSWSMLSSNSMAIWHLMTTNMVYSTICSMSGSCNALRTADHKGRTLQYYGPIDFDVDSVHTPRMLKAYVSTILLPETASIWFHTSVSNIKSPPYQYFKSSNTTILD